jgi:hypothetical protein
MPKFTDYIFTVESTVAGIPCTIAVTTCKIVKGSYSYFAASDMDYHGYEDIEYEVLDRKGYLANWLSKKLTKDDDYRIVGEIIDHYKNQYLPDRDYDCGDRYYY